VRATDPAYIEFSVRGPVNGEGRQFPARHLKHRAGLDVIDSTQAPRGIWPHSCDEIPIMYVVYIRLLAIC